MRSEKLIFVFLVLLSCFLVLFYFWGLRKEFRSASEGKISNQATIDQMKKQVRQLEEFRDSLKNSEARLSEELSKEREKVMYLDENLKKSVSLSKSLKAKIVQYRTDHKKLDEFQSKLEELSLKNDLLRKSLDESRKKFELIEPIKEKLSEVGGALVAMELKKGKEELISVQFDSIAKQLSGINNYMLQLLENNISPIKPFPALGEKAADKNPPEEQDIKKYREAAENAAARAESSEKERALVKQQYLDAQLQLEQNSKELNARAEKIFTLQEKVMNMENRVFEIQSSFKEMEKNAAVLREKYVSVELEKSGLQIALDQTRQELAQLQSKFLSLLGRIGGIFNSPDENNNPNNPGKQGRSNSTKIDVELIPQETK
jgi:chromosome segregation ATPase